MTTEGETIRKIPRGGLSDTHPEAQAVQVECFRRMTPARRCAIMRSLTATTITNARRAVAKTRPHLSESEQRLFLIELMYGTELARQIGSHDWP